MINTIKQYCIDSDLISLYGRATKSLRIHDYNELHGTNFQCPFSYDDALDMFNTYFCDDEIRKECERLSNSYYQRVNRVHKRIALIMDFDECLFLTLTFTDKCLSSTTPETRRQYVRRWLDKNCILYVANIDYGSKNGREHYHAFCLPYGHIDYKSFGHGAVNGKPKYNNNDKAISKYIAKLTNHAIKATTKNHKIIYSRQNDFINYLVTPNNKN